MDQLKLINESWIKMIDLINQQKFDPIKFCRSGYWSIVESLFEGCVDPLAFTFANYFVII